MDADRILDELTYAEGLPKAAIKMARRRSAELAPRVVQEIEAYLAAGPEARVAPSELFFIIHLLGEWRATAAYRPLAALIRRPSAEVDEMLGDAVTTTLHRVMAGVFDGDPRPIYDVILDAGADEFVRDALFDTLVMLALNGALDRAEVARFLRDCFTELRPQGTNYAWAGWQHAIARLGLSDLGSLVEQAFDRGYIDPWWLGYDHFLEDLQAAVDGKPPPLPDGEGHYEPLDDIIGELSGWHAFSERRERDRPEAAVSSFATAPVPALNPHRNVGRNDPCPCGSGKKFKRCCLH